VQTLEDSRAAGRPRHPLWFGQTFRNIEVAGRAMEDQRAQFRAEVEQKLDQARAQQDREIEALSQATDATSRQIIFDKITVIKGAIESYERWLKK